MLVAIANTFADYVRFVVSAIFTPDHLNKVSLILKCSTPAHFGEAFIFDNILLTSGKV
jgi:hypothetical protein